MRNFQAITTMNRDAIIFDANQYFYNVEDVSDARIEGNRITFTGTMNVDDEDILWAANAPVGYNPDAYEDYSGINVELLSTGPNILNAIGIVETLIKHDVWHYLTSEYRTKRADVA